MDQRINMELIKNICQMIRKIKQNKISRQQQQQQRNDKTQKVIICLDDEDETTSEQGKTQIIQEIPNEVILSSNQQEIKSNSLSGIASLNFTSSSDKELKKYLKEKQVILSEDAYLNHNEQAQSNTHVSNIADIGSWASDKKFQRFDKVAIQVDQNQNQAKYQSELDDLDQTVIQKSPSINKAKFLKPQNKQTPNYISNMQLALKRIQGVRIVVNQNFFQELKDLQKEPLGDLCPFLGPDMSQDNPFKWYAIIIGPENTPFHGGTFRLQIEFLDDYPYEPPKVEFQTKIYHPNISSNGEICLDILRHRELWSPALNIQKLVISIISLMGDPNPEDALCPDIAKEYMRDKKKYESVAMRWTKLYAN
ncbi:ubiquitin-conjugating enzyme [Stylonychia lemnae]|uniref:Ubiquitin-conjugating enzyme n=1 Tax=Stylonychia lemnae TaxID=5949 RepID=A0A078AY01_STYLE|nr:ubiquitin-conjugating enzyme [Stylonychia lemnae]|eukprot:CDW85663.1 ubiquitin-conjugating enzyme [Stylonychia lemnae]